MKGILIFALIFVFVLSGVQNLTAASSPTLLCLNKGDELEFSKCNSKIDDRVCEDELGCQYCVTEIRNGVYCPRNINDCNYAHLSCTPKKNSIIDGNSNENNNQDNNQNNNQNDNSQNNNNNQNDGDLNSEDRDSDDDSKSSSLKLGSSSSVSTRISTLSDDSQKYGSEEIEESQENISLKENPSKKVLFILVGISLVEFLALAGLIFYSSFRNMKIGDGELG